MHRIILMLATALVLGGCGGKKVAADTNVPEIKTMEVTFDADSAYSYVAKQVAFGPRVPNTEAHRLCGEWLVGELKKRGLNVIEQRAQLKAFDGTKLNALNIFGQFNPEKEDRLLLLAHWDCRPWADQDPDPAKRKLPVDGANDGASGVGVILEIARQLSLKNPDKGVDVLFVDAEDWGTEGDEQSWAMGARYFMEHLPVENYIPREAILLDMVGGKDAVFCREYFSEQAAPRLAQSLWGIAESLGHGSMFLNQFGGAVTDDHVQLIGHGIPTVDIIEYHPQDEVGFDPDWHTSTDNLNGIDPTTLQAVGETVLYYIITNY
ncbi:MAG: M28 family peptidase [Bacteroides sp.]|nr:M28 family peptidase [Bacteroides sp.]